MTDRASRKGTYVKTPPPGGFSTLEHAKKVTLACRDDPDFFAYAETVLEAKASWPIYVDELADEAELRCWGCPFTGTCARAARAERYTGIAGAKPWRDGDDATTLPKPDTQRGSNQYVKKERDAA